MKQTPFIPRPLVRTNQWAIVLSVVVSWLTHQYCIMLIPLVSGVLGIIFDFNPVMRLAKLFLRKPLSNYIPEDPSQQKFNQYIAITCLCASVIAFYMHWVVVGYVFSTLVAIAAFVAILGFCIGCFIRFQWSQYRYRQNLRTKS